MTDNDYPLNNYEESSGECESFEKRVMNMANKIMTQERSMNAEMLVILKDEIKYLKDDIKHKNTMIELLLMDKLPHNSVNQAKSSSAQPLHDIDTASNEIDFVSNGRDNMQQIEDDSNWKFSNEKNKRKGILIKGKIKTSWNYM